MQRAGEYEKPVILVVAPKHEEDCRALTQILSAKQYAFFGAGSVREAQKYITKKCFRVSVVMCQENLPDGTWRLVLEMTKNSPQKPRLVVYSRDADDHLWTEALNYGAYDVLLTPFYPKEVTRVLELATFPVQTMHA